MSRVTALMFILHQMIVTIHQASAGSGICRHTGDVQLHSDRYPLDASERRHQGPNNHDFSSRHLDNTPQTSIETSVLSQDYFRSGDPVSVVPTSYSASYQDIHQEPARTSNDHHSVNHPPRTSPDHRGSKRDGSHNTEPSTDTPTSMDEKFGRKLDRRLSRLQKDFRILEGDALDYDLPGETSNSLLVVGRLRMVANIFEMTRRICALMELMKSDPSGFQRTSSFDKSEMDLETMVSEYQHSGMVDELIQVGVRDTLFLHFRETDEPESCSICFAEYKVGQKITTLCCKHAYHTECVTKWLAIDRSCPLCRATVK
ncbi:hypothetical protein SeLEV6574_g05504 [Synchytrium endobioticum]|uniref:RING-type domain-containing protein n=1 Tax=Synchytrium endobioticum TaxID=286115 RepID=A0A507CTZ4_9FUNG|nr:hypothetical protein SeLEV6574_g05504 [Synchytrium endobioticum]